MAIEPIGWFICIDFESTIILKTVRFFRFLIILFHIDIIFDSEIILTIP